MFGYVKFYRPEKCWGFLVADTGEDIFFHRKFVIGPNPVAGDLVQFEIGDGDRGACALDLRVVEV